ncbi:phage tail tape measure protein [Corynebacterium durum]|uniref:phage tail tape measure protein n=1 Tax=Corynebacterium durum TaxID=61592 RepID=UPI00389AB348
MVAVGYASLPITPSLRGVQSAINSALKGPLDSASKQAASIMEKNLTDGANAAADAVVKARKREEYAAREVIDAEKALLAQKEKTKQATEAIEIAEKKLQSVRSAGDAQVSKAEADLAKLRDSGKASVEQLEAAEKKLQAVREKVDANVSSAELNVSKAREKSRLANEALGKSEESLAYRKTKAQEASENVIAATKRMDDAQSAAAKSSLTWGNSLDGASIKAGGFGKAIAGTLGTVTKFAGVMAAGVGIAGGGAFFGDAISKGRELSQVMGELQAVTGSTGDVMSRVSQRAKDLGNDETLAGTSAASATDAMLALAKGGLSVDQAMDAAKGSIQLAGAAQIDAGQAADIQVAALNSFHLAAGDAARVADVLTNAANNSATGVAELADSLKYAAPTASTLGIGLEDTSAMLGIFANQGIKGSEAGTAMRSALLSLTSPSKEGAKALDQMGIKAFDAEGKFVGLRAISDQLAQAQDRMGESAFTAAAATAFGREAVSFATVAAHGGAEAFDQMRASLDRQGSAGETAGAKLAGLNGAMDRIGNAADDFKLRLYELAEPTLTAWADRLAQGIQWIGERIPAVVGAFTSMKTWIEQNKIVVDGLVVTIGALTAGMIAFNLQQSITAAGGLLAFFRELTIVQKVATATQWLFNAALWASPITWIVAGIAAVVGALTLFFTKTETGREIWGNFVGFLGETLDRVKQLFGTLKDAFGEVFTAFQGGDAGYGALESLFGSEAAQRVVDFADRLGVAFQNIKAAWGELTAAFQGDDAGYGGLAALFGDEAAQGIVNAFDAMGRAMEWVRGIVVDSLSGALSSLWETVKTLTFTLVDLSVSLGGAVWNSLQGLWNLLQGLWNLLEPVLMPVLKALGFVIGGTIVVAVVAAVKVFEGLAWVLQQATNVLSWIVTNGFIPLVNILGLVVEWVGTRLGDAINAGIGFLGVAWNAMATGIQWAWDNIILPAWSAMDYFARVTLATIGTLVLAPLLIAWNLLSSGIQWAWDNLIRPTWDAMNVGINVLWNAVLLPIFNWIGGAWNAMAAVVRLGWDTVIKPAWDALAAGANWLWGAVLNVVFNWIHSKWTEMSNLIRWAYDTIIKPAWDAVAASINWLWNNVFNPIVGFMKDAWNGWGIIIRWVYDNVVKPTWDAVAGALNWLWNNVTLPILTWMGDKWNEMGNGIKWVADNVVHPVFDGLRGGLDRLRGWFHDTVENIGKIWDGIKEKTRKPVEFVVNTVYNNGIRKAWNAVAKLVGLGDLPEHKFATGGVLPGYSPGIDNYRFFNPRFGFLDLGGGEAIMRPEVTRAMGGKPAVDALNKAAQTQGVMGVRKMLGAGAAYAKGGVFGPNGGTPQVEEFTHRIAGLFNELKSEHGKPYQYGGVGNPSWDCSGLWSGITQYLNGGSLRGGRIFNTESNFGQFGFVPGLNGRVTIGVLSGKGGGANGHMAGTIDGTNLESSGDNGVQIGGRARGSDNSLFNHTYTLAKFLGEFLSGGNGGGGFNLGAMVKGLWDAAINKIGDFPGKEQHGDFGKLPGAIAKTLADKAWDFIKSKIGTFSGAAGVAGNAESWREMAMAAMRRQGFNADDPRQVNAMLAQIQSESGGNPGIAQQIVDQNGTGESAGVGLLQIIPGTFAANRDPELPNDRRDPWANMNAALRYYRSRYGTDLTTMWGHGHGYATGGVLPDFGKMHLYDQGGFIPHGGLGLNLSGRPEPVLTAPQWDNIGQLVGQMGNLIPVLDKLATSIGLAPVSPAINAINTGIAQVNAEIARVNDNIMHSVDVANRMIGGDLRAGLTLGAGMVDTTKEVVDAENALKEARKQATENSESTVDLEKKLADAREELAKAEKEGGGLSTAQRRKLQDAEEALAAARQSGNPSKIASAEKRLARVREDNAAALEKSENKNAKNVKNALNKVEQAEDKLADAREKGATQAQKIADAEAKVIKARIEAVGGIVTHTIEGLQLAAASMSKFFSTIADIQQAVEKTRTETQKLRLSLATDTLDMFKAQFEARNAEWEMSRTRLQGAVDVAKAEGKLAEERAKQALAGETGVNALGRAMDRFRETGVFSIERMSESVLKRTSDIAAAEWNVAEARAKAALDQEKAALNQAQAALAEQEAALQHAYTAQMLQLSVAKLTDQAKSFYGLTESQASGAKRGIAGIGGLLGGILKLVGGGVGVAASLATGNIPGAVLAGATALGGLTEGIAGVRDIFLNKKEIGDAWKAMDWKGKLAMLLGVGGSAAITAAGAVGAVQGGGPELASATAKLSEQWNNATWGSFTEWKKAQADKLAEGHANKTDLLQKEFEARKAQIELEKSALNLESLRKTQALQQAQEFAKLQQEIAKASTKAEALALNALAEDIKSKQDKSLEHNAKQEDYLRGLLAGVDKVVEERSRKSGAAGNKGLNVTINMPAGKTAWSTDEVKALVDKINGLEDSINIKLAELEGTSVPGADFADAHR